MSEENKTVEPAEQNVQATTEVKEEVKEQPKVNSFTQEQLDNIIKQRLEAEKRKHEKQLEEIKRQDEEALKEKEIKEAKSKAELEKLMQERIAEKNTEILKYKNEIKKERIDNSVLSVASKMNAINPQQVVDLLKRDIKLNDDNRIEILDNNSNIRYNEKGELLTIEQRVKEFLDANPHFSQGSKSGTGSQSSIEGKTVKPFNIQDLDMSKPEDRAKYAEYRKQRDSKPTQINLNK
tara:strand:- start:394 stop:1101 length:708 start_codon:yes stop_codon:yes gene_type:complete